MKFAVTFTGRLKITTDDEELDASLDVPTAMADHLDGVMDELLTLAAEDPRIDLEVTTGSVDLSVVIDAPNPVIAVTYASGLLRSAIHAAGGYTPDWPTEQTDAWEIRLIDVRSSEVLPTPIDETSPAQLVDA